MEHALAAGAVDKIVAVLDKPWGPMIRCAP